MQSHRRVCVVGQSSFWSFQPATPQLGTSERHWVSRASRSGVDNVTFETDYPHTDSTWPDTLAVVEKMFTDLDDETIYKIVRGNALRMLDLPN